MKFSIRGFVAFYSLILLVNPLLLFCQKPEPGKGNGISFLEKQHPFEDAKQLDGVVVNGGIETKKIKLVLKILAKYIEDDALKEKMDSTDNWDETLGNEIIEAFKISTPIGRVENPFLGEYLEILKKTLGKYRSAPPTEKVEATVTPEVVPETAAEGILPPVMVVDALGSFLAKRFKEELAIAFLDKFREKLETSPFGSLFPSVTGFLKSSGIFNFKLFLPTLKEAFHMDLNKFDSNLKNFLKAYKEKLEEAVMDLLKSGDRLNELEKKLPPEKKEAILTKLQEKLTLEKKEAILKSIEENLEDELPPVKKNVILESIKENLKEEFPPEKKEAILKIIKEKLEADKILPSEKKDAILKSIGENLKEELPSEKKDVILESIKENLEAKEILPLEKKEAILKIIKENLEKKLPLEKKEAILKNIKENLKSCETVKSVWRDHQVDLIEKLGEAMKGSFRNKIMDKKFLLEWKKNNGQLSKEEKETLIGLKNDLDNIDALSQWGENNRKVINLAIFVLDLIHGVKNGKHPADIICDSSESDYIKQIGPKFSTPIKLLALISRNLKNKEGNGWVKLDLPTIADPDFLELFLGLIYVKELEKLKEIKFGNESFDQIIVEGEYIKKDIDHIRKALAIAQNIQDKIEELRDIEKKGFEKYYSYLTTVFKLIEYGFDIRDIITESKLSKIEELNKEIEKSSGQKKKDKENEKKDLENKYNLIIEGISDIEEAAQKYLEDAKKLLEISKNIYDKTYGAALVNALDLLERIFPEESPIKKGVVKYMSFAINFVNSKKAKELQEILESAALPVGSYRLKRTSRFNISLNAYPGGFIGGELLTPGEQEIKGEPLALNLAFTAPVGLAFSWGKVGYKIVKSEETADQPEQRKRKIGPSHSVFLSAIDIGAVMSFRLSGADSGLPEFKWQNILAPGLYYMYGFKNSPISVGIGIQYGPQLREIRAAEAAVNGANGTNSSNGGNGENGETDSQDAAEGIIKSSAFRFGLIFAVDIPIFNLHSKQK